MHWSENMSAPKNPRAGWRREEILIRPDIFFKAADMHLDISDECNRALAAILGIDFTSEPEKAVAAPPPVAIAGIPAAGQGSEKKATARRIKVSPVMNAEDPMAPATVLREKKEAAMPKPRAAHPPPAAPAQEVPAAPENTQPLSDKPAKHGTEKKTKDSTIKKFVKTRIIRASEESPDMILPKDELFQMFERWCREQDITKIPDRKSLTVALKTQYAFTERTVGGKSCWMNIRIR